MKVKEAIEILLKLNQESNIKYLCDGAARNDANVVYESKNGNVIIADNDMVCYDNEDRPIGAPTEKQDKYWETQSKSK